MTKHITDNTLRLRADAKAMKTKGNVVLFLDKKLVEKSKSPSHFTILFNLKPACQQAH